MSDESPNFCPRCGIPFAFDTDHPTPQHCIDALRLSLKRQEEASQGLAFEVSTRLFAVLEGLADDPSVAGIEFSTFNHDTGERTKLHKQTVSGVMTAIFREYQQMGNWSPMRDLKEEHDRARKCAYSMVLALEAAAEIEPPLPDKVSKQIGKALAEASQLGLDRRVRGS